MPAKEVSMNKFKIILRLHHESKLSQHQIAQSLKLSVGVVNKYLQRAKAANLSWPLSSELEDEGLLKKLIKSSPLNPARSSAASIDFPRLHQEMKRKGVTQQLLWEEEIKAGTVSISYPQFSLRYRNWKAVQPKSMRQVHRAGDKVFVDYAGPTMDIIDPKTGEVIPVQIFVGVLGASNYTFAEATRSQGLADWIGSHQRMFEFFDGVPALVVPDNLRSAVTKSCRYEPDINKTYADFIDYYGTAVLPARPYKPKDKAKAENAVLIVERWIMARLRHQTFLGLAALNQAIRALLAELNQRPFKKLPGCRQLSFATYDKPALRPLPQYPYQYMEIKKARVHVDYHVELLGHYYSVPYAFIKKEIDLRFNAKRVECWHQGKQIALHQRSFHQGRHTTLPDHMPKAHRKHMEWTPGRFLNWAADIGEATTRLVHHLLTNKPHPEHGYRSCLGLLRLVKAVGEVRLEKACLRAMQLGTNTRRSVQSILDKKLEDQPISKQASFNLEDIPWHDNIRGNHYYH